MTGPAPRHLVADASVIVALLVDAGANGQWAASHCAGARLVSPEILPFEVGNALRRHERAGLISGDRAELAHRTLMSMHVDYVPYRVLADAIWNLRQRISTYDAGYVALAHAVGAPLLTLDLRLVRAVDSQVEIRTPPP